MNRRSARLSCPEKSPTRGDALLQGRWHSGTSGVSCAAGGQRQRPPVPPGQVLRRTVTGATSRRTAPSGARFAAIKFRPPGLPATLVRRPVLQERLTAGASKSVLLADWAATPPAGRTFWLAGDRADADPVRFWSGFIEAPRGVAPEFGTDAGQLLAMDGVMSADVTASIANDTARLPAGSVFVVDDFHFAAGTAGKHMIDLIEHWPAGP